MESQRADKKDTSARSKIRRRGFLALSGSAIAGGCAAPQANELAHESAHADESQDTPWRGKRYDAANTAYNPDATGAGEDVRSVWQSYIGNITSTPIVVDGTLYTGGGRNFYAIDLEDGSKQWEIETNVVTGTHSPAAAGDTVYGVGQQNGEGRLFALSPDDGTVNWTRSISMITSPTATTDTVYIGGSEGSRGHLYAVDAATGDQRWKFSIPEGDSGEIADVPAVSGGTVYCTANCRVNDQDGSERGLLYALDVETGADSWSIEADGPVVSAPTATAETVYFADDGRVYAVSTETGEERWTYEVDGSIGTSLAVADGDVYVRDTIGALLALDRAHGRVRWSTDVDSSDIAPTVGGDTIYIGGNELHALDRTDGSVQWSYNVSAYSSSHYAPAVSRTNVFYGICIKENAGEEYDNYIYSIT